MDQSFAVRALWATLTRSILPRHFRVERSRALANSARVRAYQRINFIQYISFTANSVPSSAWPESPRRVSSLQVLSSLSVISKEIRINSPQISSGARFSQYPNLESTGSGNDVPMTEKMDKQDGVGMDDLSRLQKALDELSVQLYTCIGIIQRDAPPIARPPEEADEAAADEVERQKLLAKVPQFARDVVARSRAVDAVITDVEARMKEFEGKERTQLDTANFESRQVGEEMTEAADDAQKLLASVRDIIAARETES